MLGRQGSSFLLFGLLTRGPDGAFYLEDLDDKVELDFSEAVSSLFVAFLAPRRRVLTKNCHSHRRQACSQKARSS